MTMIVYSVITNNVTSEELVMVSSYWNMASSNRNVLAETWKSSEGFSRTVFGR